MKDFPNTLCNLAAAAVLLAATACATSAAAGVTGARAGNLRSYEPHKPSDAAGARGQVAANCMSVSLDRNVGSQRVWTPHGVIAVGGHSEKVASTECR